MKTYIMELPDDFEQMKFHEQEMNMELAYRKRKEAVDITKLEGSALPAFLTSMATSSGKPVKLFAAED